MGEGQEASAHQHALWASSAQVINHQVSQPSHSALFRILPLTRSTVPSSAHHLPTMISVEPMLPARVFRLVLASALTMMTRLSSHPSRSSMLERRMLWSEHFSYYCALHGVKWTPQCHLQTVPCERRFCLTSMHSFCPVRAVSRDA